MVMRSVCGDSGVASSRKIVTLRQGMVNGVRDKLPNGSDYYYFKGIPYARPPVGDLRFEAPVPLDKFPATVLDCSKERSSCIGMNMLTREISGKEDGLYLNVYTPVIPTRGGVEPKLPVMVFVHGGGMIGGSGDSLLYNPNFMVQEGVVFVTMNYRVGVLGLLCLPEAGIHGNEDLKDQHLALRWVNEHIVKFGGDPSNVTLFGASSGGSCVGLHCTSASSRKYFHKAILQCGHHLCDFTYSDRAVQKARDLAKHFGFSGGSDKEALQVLKNVPADQLVAQQSTVLSPRERELEEIYQVAFGHVIEQKDSKHAVLTTDPLEFFKNPNSFGIPVIIGYNDGEGSMEVMNILRHLNDYNSQPERLIPRSLNVDYFGPTAKQVGEEIKQLMIGDKPLTEDMLQEILEFISEKYAYTAYVFAYFWSKFQHDSNLYCYRFTFDGLLNTGKVLTKIPPFKGAGHMDELFYLFTSALAVEVTESDKAYQMRQTMVRMWTNFAKCSNPTPASDERLNFRWNPIRNGDPNGKDDFQSIYLNIDQEMKMDLPDPKRLQGWVQLHNKYNGEFTKLAYAIDDMNVKEQF
ncbi:esterase B1-like [Ochlerotatus camptorhynchus]|uniref:esterase B1-like n=1 Tax=Ochlerotatus camptorhynchus TaxID=644619 RepID=UPI0031D48FD2